MCIIWPLMQHWPEKGRGDMLLYEMDVYDAYYITFSLLEVQTTVHDQANSTKTSSKSN